MQCKVDDCKLVNLDYLRWGSVTNRDNLASFVIWSTKAKYCVLRAYYKMFTPNRNLTNWHFVSTRTYTKYFFFFFYALEGGKGVEEEEEEENHYHHQNRIPKECSDGTNRVKVPLFIFFIFFKTLKIALKPPTRKIVS